MKVDAVIRDERATDVAAIRRVNIAAFEADDEADLVDQLRTDGDVVVSLVAELDATIVGHILFSRLSVDANDHAVSGAALAPMAVVPRCQNLGIGSALVNAGLQRCRRLGVELVAVLGHQNYYPRFGFSAELAKRLGPPYGGPSFMALELVPNVLRRRCRVRYAEAFSV